MPGAYKTPGADGVMAQLALAMIEGCLAVPGDWKGDLHGMLETTLHRWIGTVGGNEIQKKWFGFYLTLTNAPVDPEIMHDEDTEAASGRIFLNLFPQVGGHSGIYLAKPLSILEKADPRFPAWFYQRLTAVKRFVPIWGLDEAVEEEVGGWWGELLEMNEREDGDMLRPSKAYPACLKRRKVADETVRRVLRERYYPPTDRYVGALMWGALELAELAMNGDNGWSSLTDAERGAFDGYFGWNPSLLLMMEEDDAFAHLWDYNGDAVQNSGEPLMPACIWPFSPTVSGVVDVFGKLEHCCKVLRKAGELIDRLARPNPLAWELLDKELPEGDDGVLEALRLTVGAS